MTGVGCWILMGGAWSWKDGVGRVGERGVAYCVVAGCWTSPFSAEEWGSIAWAVEKGDLGG